MWSMCEWIFARPDEDHHCLSNTRWCYQLVHEGAHASGAQRDLVRPDEGQMHVCPGSSDISDYSPYVLGTHVYEHVCSSCTHIL